MKKKYIIAVYIVTMHIVLLAVIIRSQLFQTKSELTPHYYNMVAFHQRIDKNLASQSSLFIGDSLMQGLAVSSVIEKSANFGIGNDTTGGVIQRLTTLKSITNAKFVILAIGINDFRYRNTEEIIVNYNVILEILSSTRHVVISAILPVDEFVFQGVDNAKIQQLNIALEVLSRDYPNTSFLNVSDKLTVLDNLSAKYHVGDGVHLNNAGNALWIQSLKEWLVQYEPVDRDDSH